MGVDVDDVGGVQAGVGDGSGHGGRGSRAVGQGHREVVGVGGGGVAGDQAVRRGAAGAGVLQAFQDDESGALPHHEAVAVLVEGAGGVFGVVVAQGDGVEVAESGEGDGGEGVFGAAGDDEVGAVCLQEHQGVADGVGAAGAGVGDGEGGAGPAEADGDVGGGRVGHRHQRHQRVDAGGAALGVVGGLQVAGGAAADGVADDDGGAAGLGGRRAGVAVGGEGRGGAVVGEGVHAAGFLGREESGQPFQAADGAADAHPVAAEVGVGEGGGGGAAGAQRVPQCVRGAPAGGDHAHTGDGYGRLRRTAPGR